MKAMFKNPMGEIEKSLETNHPELAQRLKRYRTVVAEKENDVKTKVTDLSIQSAMRLNKVRLIVANSFGNIGRSHSSNSVSSASGSNSANNTPTMPKRNGGKGRFSLSIFHHRASTPDTVSSECHSGNESFIDTEFDNEVTPNSMPMPIRMSGALKNRRDEELFDANEIIKYDILLKQSSKTKAFVPHYFVLRRGSLIYFNEQKDFERFMERNASNIKTTIYSSTIPMLGRASASSASRDALMDDSKEGAFTGSKAGQDKEKSLSFGKIYFSEVSTPAGTACAALPHFLAKLLHQQSYVLCIFTELRSFVIAAKNKELLQSWIPAINEAYSAFLAGYNKQVQAIMESSNYLGATDIFAQADMILKSKSSKDVVPELLKMLDGQFAKESEILLLYYKKQQAFEAWKMFVKLKRDKDMLCV